MYQKTPTKEETMQALAISDIDRRSMEADIEFQRWANQNERDRVAMEKVRLCAGLLSCDQLDNLDFGLVRKKLMELVAGL